MALPLDQLADGAHQVPGLEVRRVRSQADLDAMSRVAAANWTPPDGNVIDFYRRAAAVYRRLGFAQFGEITEFKPLTGGAS